MQARMLRRDQLIWLSPVIGALAPATYFAVRSSLAGRSSEILIAFAFWVLRDLILGYCMALPVLAVLRRFGAERIGLMWAAAALVGAPMGYVLANPVTFAWTPTEEQFEHGPYWFDMLIYMVLFGLSGVMYAYLHRRWAPSKHAA